MALVRLVGKGLPLPCTCRAGRRAGRCSWRRCCVLVLLTVVCSWCMVRGGGGCFGRTAAPGAGVVLSYAVVL